jgi:hypothetical protein
VPLKIIYLLVRQVPGLAVLVFRTDLAKDAELLVLRHENAVLRRHASRVRYEPASFDAVFQAAGARILRTAVQAPRMNATCERLVGTLRRAVLDRMLILGGRHLHAVLTEYQVHYNTARHQGIAQRVPDDECGAPRATVTDIDTRQIRRKPVLGGLINEYTYAA